jgi:hypothetical protein
MNPHPADPTAYRDREHLRLLSIFHYVMAGIAALFSLLPVIHLVLGVAMLSGAIGGRQRGPDARIVGAIFTMIAVLMILTGLSYAACLAYAGRCLAQRKNYIFCLVVAGISCMFTPLGTVLGVFTIIVLLRDSVARAFGRPVAGTARE